MQIRIMSSNIWSCSQPTANRDDLLAEVYFKYRPLTIGIQECSPEIRAEEKSLLDLCAPDYLELNPAPENITNFTPILYNRCLTVENSGWILFDGLNNLNSKSITWGLFSLKNKRFIHINVHYYYETNEQGAQARQQNSAQLLQLIGQLQCYQAPVIVTGDFNCEERSKPLQALLHNGLTLASSINPQKVCSYHVFPQYDEEKNLFFGGSPLHPSYTAEDSLDHIFLQNAVCTRFVTVQDQEALDASDHCPIYADIEI